MKFEYCMYMAEKENKFPNKRQNKNTPDQTSSSIDFNSFSAVRSDIDRLLNSKYLRQKYKKETNE